MASKYRRSSIRKTKTTHEAQSSARVLDRSATTVKLEDDLVVCLQPKRPSTALRAALTSLHGHPFYALVALQLHAVTPENVHLEAVLAVSRRKPKREGGQCMWRPTCGIKQ